MIGADWHEFFTKIRNNNGFETIVDYRYNGRLKQKSAALPGSLWMLKVPLCF